MAWARDDLYTSSATINACVKGQQSERALELQAGMHGLGSELDVIYFSTASCAYDKGHKPERAHDLLA